MEPPTGSGGSNSSAIPNKSATDVKSPGPTSPGLTPLISPVKEPATLPMGGSNQLPPTLTSSMVPPVKSADVLMRKSNKGGLLVLILVVLILGLLGGGGFYAYQIGWLDPVLDMVFKEAGPVSPTDTAAEQLEPSPTSTVPLPSPMPVAVTIPEGWLTLNSQRCGIDISYPQGWSGQPNCRSINEGGAADCVMSENFSGVVTGAEPAVTQGMLVMLQDCASNPEGSTYTVDKFLQSCNQTNQELGLEACQLMGTTGVSFVKATPGQYVTVINGVSYTIQVFPPPPTTFSLLNQMLGTFRVATGGLGVGNVTPTVASESGTVGF